MIGRSRAYLFIPVLVAACSSARSDGNVVPPAKSSKPVGPQPDFGQLVELPETPPPISGGTLAVSRTVGIAVAADSDRDRVYVVDLPNRAIRHTVNLPHRSEPGRVALDGSNRAHVALRNTGELVTIDLATGQWSTRAACIAPRGVTFDSKNDTILVACASGDLLTFPSAGGAAKASVALGRDLRDVVLTGTRILTTRFRNAHVIKIGFDGLKQADEENVAGQDEGGANLAWRAVAVPPNPETAQGSSTGPSDEAPSGTAIVTQDPSPVPVRVEAGGYGDVGASFGDGSCEHVGIVSTRLWFLDTNGSVRLPSAVLPVDLATNGREFVVVAAGNAHTKELPQLFVVHRDQLVGKRECVATIDGNVPGQAIAAAFDDKDELLVQTREPAALHIMTADRKRPWKTIVLATDSKEDTGHAIFHANAGGNISCASCHAEGADDAHTWKFEGMGPRRTPSLLGTTPNTEPFHWSGDMKDLSMLVDHVFVERMSGPRIDKKQVNTLGNFIFKLPAPAKLRNERDISVRGKELFEKRCQSCHSGSLLTNNITVDVGSAAHDPNLQDAKQFQVPSLVGVAWRAPYLHTGCAKTLFDRFDPACGGDRHGDIADLDRAQITDLVSFLETL